jgi:DNA-binding transcriptional LysR family regulator
MQADGRLLSGLSVLVAVVEAGSFIRAGDVLHMTQPAVSRAIARLEGRLGIRLLNRTTRALTLTAEGRRFYEEISPLLMGIGDAVTLASRSSAIVSGRLRVNIDPFFSRLLFAPQINKFLSRYPELSLELITRDSLGDLVAEGFDIAVRFGEQPPSSLVARKLLETRILTVAAPSYIAVHGRPKHPHDLQKHDCIQFRDPVTGKPFEWEFHRGREIVPVRTTGRLLLTDVGTMLGACIAGAGIAQVMALGVEDLLEQGLIVELFPNWPGETFPLYALYHSRQLPPAKLRAFIDFALELTKAETLLHS